MSHKKLKILIWSATLPEEEYFLSKQFICRFWERKQHEKIIHLFQIQSVKIQNHNMNFEY